MERFKKYVVWRHLVVISKATYTTIQLRTIMSSNFYCTPVMSCHILLTFCLLSLGYLCELPGLPVELGELLGEVRSLRAQLQNSVQENSALKQLELHKQLEQKLGVGSPRTPSLSALTASPQRENFYRRQLLHGKRQTLLLMILHIVHT